MQLPAFDRALQAGNQERRRWNLALQNHRLYYGILENLGKIPGAKERRSESIRSWPAKLSKVSGRNVSVYRGSNCPASGKSLIAAR
jgi:hypothetical protein